MRSLYGLPPGPSAKRLLVVGLIDSTGNGAYVSTSVVLFSVVLHLTPAQIGQGLALGGLTGLAFIVPWGALADRVGVRPILLSIYLWRALGNTSYIFVHNFAGYLLAVAFLGIGEQASPPVLLAFVTSAMNETDRVKTAAAVQSIRNAGFTIGALVGSLALLVVGRVALDFVVLGNAVSFVIAAYILAGIKLRGTVVRVRKGGRGNREVQVRRRPAFLTLTALNGILNMHPSILQVGLPLWIVTRELAPKYLVSVLYAINTITVVVLQVRLARRTESARVSARMLCLAGATLLACVAVLALTGVHVPFVPHGVWAAVVLLVIATFLLTFGEMWQTAGAWGASLALSPASARVRFLAVFNLGPTVRNVCGPLIITAWVLRYGAVGWLVLGGVLVAAGLAVLPVSEWAERERDHHAREDRAAESVAAPSGSV
jgi:Major Facilitator Superfamily